MTALPEIAPGTALIIRTDGSEGIIDNPTLDRVRKAIGAATLDVVILSTRGPDARPDLVMAVDDGGYEAELREISFGRFEMVPTKARKPVNAKATAFYHLICLHGTTHQIVGDVAIMHDGEFAPRRRL